MNNVLHDEANVSIIRLCPADPGMTRGGGNVLTCPGGREKISSRKSAEITKKKRFLPGNLLKSLKTRNFFQEIS
jgi:hypothetical protein